MEKDKRNQESGQLIKAKYLFKIRFVYAPPAQAIYHVSLCVFTTSVAP